METLFFVLLNASVFWQIHFCSSVIFGMWASDFLSEAIPLKRKAKLCGFQFFCHFAGRAFTLPKPPEPPTPGHPWRGWSAVEFQGGTVQVCEGQWSKLIFVLKTTTRFLGAEKKGVL